MKNKAKIALVCFAGILTLFALILFCQSIQVNDDGWGTDVSSNEDLLVGLLVSIIVLSYSILNLVTKKTEEEIAFNKYVCFTTATGLISLYSFGKFFKNLAKAISKGKDFVYADYQIYLYLGIVLIPLLIYSIFKVLEKKKKTN